jgi:hypothetical protein
MRIDGGESCRQELKNGGEGFDARAMLAQALVRLGKIDEAAEVLQKLQDLPDDPARSYEDLALAARPVR